MSTQKVTVTGAGGFIGHHLCKYLVEHGYWVRGVDIKEPEYERTAADEFELLDLTKWENCLKATRGVQQIYGLAANMGGIGFIETHKAEIVRDNTLMNLQSIEAARTNGVQRYLYTSSACVVITTKILGWTRAWCASITSLVRSALMTAAAKNPRPRYVVRSL